MMTATRENAELLKEIKTELEIDTYDSSELAELVEGLDSETDFNCTLDGADYRFISDDVIEETFAESVQEMVEDCYGIGDLPSLISCHLDWEGIVRDCMIDGYGHHFSSYDGSEHETENWYIFRTN